MVLHSVGTGAGLCLSGCLAGEKFLVVTSFLPALCRRRVRMGLPRNGASCASLALYTPNVCPGSPLSPRFDDSVSNLLLERPIQIPQVQPDTKGASSIGRRKHGTQKTTLEISKHRDCKMQKASGEKASASNKVITRQCLRSSSRSHSWQMEMMRLIKMQKRQRFSINLPVQHLEGSRANGT